MITEKLLQEVLNDFKRDGKVKLEVEDTDDSEFQDKWPWTEDRKVEPEPEQTLLLEIFPWFARLNFIPLASCREYTV